MVIQFNDEIVDKNVAPHVSKITKCGAPLLRASENYFSRYMRLASFGSKRYKPHIHALLVVFHRRVDFACVAYRQGRNRLLAYSRQPKNSNTRPARLAMCFFETCVIHAVAAIKCAETIIKSLNQTVHHDERVNRLKKISNRIRHFDEDVFDKGKVQRSFGISPVWITNEGLEAATAKLSFIELRELLKELVKECGEFNKIIEH